MAISEPHEISSDFFNHFFPCWASQCVPRCVCLSVGGCVSLQLSPFILIYVSQVCPYIFGLALLVFQCIFLFFFWSRPRPGAGGIKMFLPWHLPLVCRVRGFWFSSSCLPNSLNKSPCCCLALAGLGWGILDFMFLLAPITCLFTVPDLLILTCHSKGVLWVCQVHWYTSLYVFVGHFLWSHNFFGVISFSLECWILEIPPKIAGGPFVTPQIHGEKRWSTREASRMRHRWVMQRIDGIREDLWSIGPTMGTAWWRVTGTKGTRCKMAKLGDFSLWKIFASLGAWFCWEICCSV